MKKPVMYFGFGSLWLDVFASYIRALQLSAIPPENLKDSKSGTVEE